MKEHLFTGIGVVLTTGILSQWAGWLLRIPAMILLVTAGFVLGPVTGMIDPDKLLGNFIEPLIAFSIAIILFEGGLQLKISEIKGVRSVVLQLVTVGVLVTWAGCSFLAYTFVGMSPAVSILLGAILTVSGPTVVLPLLKHIRPKAPAGSILKWEGVIVDPVGVILALFVFQGLLAPSPGEAFWVVLTAMLKTVVIGLAVGGLAAYVLIVASRRYWFPEHLEIAIFLLFVTGAFMTANLFQPEAGLISVTLMGVILANQDVVSVSDITKFHEHLTVPLVSNIFIILTARINLNDMLSIGWDDFLFVILIIFLIRPIAVFMSSIGSSLDISQKAFMSWLAPRGIVAAATASLFSIQLEKQGFVDAGHMVTLTFLVIIGTAVTYGFTSTAVARFLKISRPFPQGILFAGASEFDREVAGSLRDSGFTVRLADTSVKNIAKARSLGLDAHHQSVLSSCFGDEISLCDIGRLAALTPNDEVNSLAVLHYAEIFGRDNVYQSAPSVNKYSCSSDKKTGFKGRLLFKPQLTREQLQERFVSGRRVRKIRLSVRFDYLDLERLFGENMVLLFMIDGKKLHIFSEDSFLRPKPGVTLVLLA